MAPTSIRMAIVATLENLSKDNVEKFCHQLIHRRGEPRIRRNKVDGKSLLQITDALVNAFTESGALEVTLEILRNIDCREDANDLVEDTKNLMSSTPTSSSSAAEASGGAASQPASPTNKHFIDEHRVILINRVTNVDAILDDLLDKVIDNAFYNKVRAKSTTEEMMRTILDGPIKSATRCKDILYEILERHEKYLVEEIKNKTA